MARRRSQTGRTGLTIIELIGLGISVFLLLISLNLIYTERLPCPRGRIFACHSVLRGHYSHIGPIPIAGMGVLYFVVQLVFTFAMRKRSSLIAILKGLSVFLGVAFIAWLRVIEIVWLKALCPWCLGVALMVIIEAIMLYDVLAPPLPRLKGYAGRTAMVIVAFFSFIGMGAALVTFAFPPKMLEPLKNPPVAKTIPKPTPKPKPVRETQGPAVVRATPTPEPEPEPAQGDDTSLAGAPYPDTEEGRIFRDRGWVLAPGMETVNDAASAHPPVLLLAYDPECPVCEWLITKQLSQEQLDQLPITRVAIDQRDMYGRLSEYVKNVPTLLLLTGPENVVFRQEGEITADDITTSVEHAIAHGQPIEPPTP